MGVLSTVKFTALRMLRNYIVLLLLLVVPIILLTVFYVILSGDVAPSGNTYFSETALVQVLVFQLFGGSIVMYLIHHDFITSHRMRIYSLPFSQTMYAFSIMVCGALFSMLLGILLMMYAQWVLGMDWGNWAWMIFIIALLAVLSIIVCLIFTFSVKNYTLAERLNEVYGVGFVLLGGFFFPMPENAFFQFMGTYGNPLTLSIGAVREMQQSRFGEAWLQANILLAAIGVLFALMVVLGRRRIG